MQTFLPYADFHQTMRCLDDKRLGNQVYREGLTLIKGGWPAHPAAKMWRAHKHLLATYCLIGLDELKKRGRSYPHWEIFFSEIQERYEYREPPRWLGDERLHSSHRANLLRKDPQWYGQFGWTEQPTEGYWWPVH